MIDVKSLNGFLLAYWKLDEINDGSIEKYTDYSQSSTIITYDPLMS